MFSAVIASVLINRSFLDSVRFVRRQKAFHVAGFGAVEEEPTRVRRLTGGSR